jgi:hypothetical protein
LGRAPPFFGNTNSAISAFLRIYAYRLKNQPITFFNLLAWDDGPFGTSRYADTTLEASLGNFISHVNLL